MWMDDYNSIIHNSQKVQMTQMFINRWDKLMWYFSAMTYVAIPKSTDTC